MEHVFISGFFVFFFTFYGCDGPEQRPRSDLNGAATGEGSRQTFEMGSGPGLSDSWNVFNNPEDGVGGTGTNGGGAGDIVETADSGGVQGDGQDGSPPSSNPYADWYSGDQTSDDEPDPFANLDLSQYDPEIYVMPEPGQRCLPRLKGADTVNNVGYPSSSVCTLNRIGEYYEVYCDAEGEMVTVHGSLRPGSLFISTIGELCGISDKVNLNYCYREGGWEVAHEYCVEDIEDFDPGPPDDPEIVTPLPPIEPLVAELIAAIDLEDHGRNTTFHSQSNIPLEMIREYIEERHEDLDHEFSYVSNTLDMPVDEKIAGTFTPNVSVVDITEHIRGYFGTFEGVDVDRMVLSVDGILFRIANDAGGVIGFDGFEQNGCAAPTPMLLICDTVNKIVYGVDLNPCRL